MSEQEQHKTGKVPLKSLLEDFRSTLTDAELRKKYRLSARAFISLIKALLGKNLINADDLAWRKKMAVERDLEKQSEFLSGLYICSNCNHPHPSPFERCPACGAEPGGSYADQELLDPDMSSSGSHFLVDDLDDAEDDDDPVLADSEDDQQPDESPEPSDRQNNTKSSPLQSVRSLISRLKKK